MGRKRSVKRNDKKHGQVEAIGSTVKVSKNPKPYFHNRDLKQLNIKLKKVKENLVKSKENLSKAGNALERVQRVHEPADLWDITFCTR